MAPWAEWRKRGPETLSLGQGHHCLRLQERGPTEGPWDRHRIGISHGGQATARTKDYELFSVNHLSTVSLFSFTHLMLALVFSRACSRARVAEPKPMFMLFFLNCSSCQEREDSQRQAGSLTQPCGEGCPILGPPRPQ